MMDEKEVLVLSGVPPIETVDSVYPMYFGASCAFVALQLLSTARGPITNCGEWPLIADRMLQGSTQLLGLLVWKAQGGEDMEGRGELLHKLKKAESEVAELKRMRTEDGKANEKVISIIATKEHNWNSERKRLMQQNQALLNDLHALETNNEEIISNLNRIIEEKERLMQLKDEELEEETCKTKEKELEDRLQMTESIAEELRETVKKEGQVHSSELWKHKTAFIELISNQRQLEAEIGRAIEQVEATKQELNATLEQRDEAVAIIQKLSLEIINMKKDSEQKDKILSAMLRKSKVDMAEKQTLLKEVKLSKARRKQAELETERWRARCEPRIDKNLRINLSNRADSRSDMESRRLASVAMASSHRWTELQPSKNGIKNKTVLHEYLESEQRKGLETISKRMSNAADNHFGEYSKGDKVEPTITTNPKRLNCWNHSEGEKYISFIDQRHHAEIDAFAEQMRLKDEKLESFRWQLLSMELELKQLQSHIEGLDENLSHFKEENMKLEVLLSERDKELISLKEKFSDFSLHALNCEKSDSSESAKHQETTPDDICSEVKIVKKKLRKNEHDQEIGVVCISGEVENDRERGNNKASAEFELSSGLTAEKEQKEKERRDINISNLFEEDIHVGIRQSMNELQREEKSFEEKVRAPADDIEHEREVCADPVHNQHKHPENNCTEDVNKLPVVMNCLIQKDIPCKMDLHALGVSYKIKRLKQQLLLVEKLAAAQTLKKPTGKSDATDTLESYERRKMDEHEHQAKGFLSLMSLINKHLKRYQNLEEKIDDLCKRMDEKEREGNGRRSSNVNTKAQTGALEQFLEGAFQVQRYMVAAGQKLSEIQSRIACSFVVNAGELDKSAGVNMSKLEDHTRTLFRDIQRGLEVRIARVIGDIQGTLACEGIMNSRN